MHRPPSVSVIGSKGFIGSQVVRQLTATGATVHTFDRNSNFIENGKIDDRLGSADVIVYAAGTITPQTAVQHPERIWHDLVLLESLLSLLSAGTRNPYIILCSSGGTIYAPAPSRPPFREDDATLPTADYGKAKLLMEKLVLGTPRVSPVILRIANVYGPNQDAVEGYGVITHWLAAIKRGLQPVVIGSLSTRRDYVHVDDVAAAIVAVCQHRTSLRKDIPSIINVGSGQPVALSELLVVIENVTGREVDFERSEARSFDAPDVWLDIQKAWTLLDWRPSVPLEDGILQMWLAM